VTREVDAALASYRFHEAAYTNYHLFWHEFCDWYLEWVKPEITRTPQGGKLPPSWINLARVFEAALRLLHPFVPFITEELWHQLPRRDSSLSISLADFNLVSERVADPISEKQFEIIKSLVVTARNAKAEMGLQNQKPSAQVACDDLRLLELFRAHQEAILRLAGVQALNFTRERLAAETVGLRSTADFDLRLFHEERVDHQAERARLEREKTKLERALAEVKAQLDSREFRSRAPQEVVRSVEHRHSELTDHYRKVLESLERLG
jgi:valyl-tRNA synthetase